MIQNKNDLSIYLEEDRKALGKQKAHPSFFGDEVWKFQIYLRNYEYCLNTRGRVLHKIKKAYYHLKYHNLGVRLGFLVPPNTCAEGLAIAHYGLLTINGTARVGTHCRIQEGVNIGSSGGSNGPQIGDNVYIGSGAKIIGDISIASNTTIGAGAVVVKSITEENTTWAGVPAKQINKRTD